MGADVRLALIPEVSTDGVARHGVQHAVVHHQRPQPLVGRRNALFGDVDIGIGLQQLPRGPALDAAAAPRAVDDPHGNAQHIVEHLGKEIADGRAQRRRLGRKFVPASGDTLFGRIGGRFRNLHIADLPAPGVGPGDDLVGAGHGAVVESQNAHLHIALAGGKPDFADQNVVQLDLAVAGNRDALRLVTARRGLQHHLPAAVVTALRSHPGAPRGIDLHRRMRIGPAPKFHIRILLQHHIVADNLRKGDLRGGGPCRGKGGG